MNRTEKEPSKVTALSPDRLPIKHFVSVYEEDSVYDSNNDEINPLNVELATISPSRPIYNIGELKLKVKKKIVK